MEKKNKLVILCSKCKNKFPAPVQPKEYSQENIQLFCSAELSNNKIECTKCGFKMLTSKPDFSYFDDQGSERLISFGGAEI